MQTAQRRRRELARGLAFLAPSLLGLVLFLVIPIGVVIFLSFHQWDLLRPMEFVGLNNWRRVLGGDRLGHSLLISALYVLLVIPLQTALGLLLATLLSRGLPGSTLFRVLFVIPWVAAPLALGVVWKWIFAPHNGALNSLLGTNIEWLSDPNLALPAVAFVGIWSQVGYTTLFFIAGLAGIPQEVVEAAEIDGANAWQVFWRIKVPLLGPTMFFILVTGVIASFQAFDHIYALTPNGGPQYATDVIATRIYLEGFGGSYNMGNAAVMALILFAILVVITLLQQRFFSKRVTYDLS